MKAFNIRLFISWIFILLLNLSALLHGGQPNFSVETQNHFNRIKESKNLLYDAFRGSTSIPEEITNYFKTIYASPDTLKQAIRESVHEPDAYKYFLLELAQSRVTANQRAPSGSIDDNSRIKYALAFLAALRHPLESDLGKFHSNVLFIFRTRILANLDQTLQVRIKQSLAQYINSPEARTVALPAMMLVADKEGVIQYLKTIPESESNVTLQLVLVALRKNQYLNILRDDPDFQSFLVKQIRSSDSYLRRLASELLVQRQSGGLILPTFERELLRVLQDTKISDDARISALRILSKNHERQWYNRNQDLDNQAVIDILINTFDLDKTSRSIRLAVLDYFAKRKSGNETALLFLIKVAMTDIDEQASKLAFEAIGSNSMQHFERRLYQDSAVQFLLEQMEKIILGTLSPRKILCLWQATNLLYKNAPKTFGSQLAAYSVISALDIRLNKLLSDIQSSLTPKPLVVNATHELKDIKNGLITLMSKKIQTEIRESLNPRLLDILNALIQEKVPSNHNDSSEKPILLKELFGKLKPKQIEELMQIETLNHKSLLEYLLSNHYSDELLNYIVKHPKFFAKPLSEVVSSNLKVLKYVVSAMRINNIRLTVEHVSLLSSILKSLPKLSSEEKSTLDEFILVLRSVKASPQRLRAFPVHSNELAEAMWQYVASDDVRFVGMKELVLELRNRLETKRIDYLGSACEQTWQDNS